jgi:predicted Ser/Thr protein kinase
MALNLKTETVFTDDTPAAQPPLPPGQIAPHFPQLEILECLGRGGMGVVYKARQKTLNRLVALKLLAPERVRDAKFAERFAREAQALAALNHPNIVTIYDFGQAGGFYFLLMEFVDGVNLRQLLRARKFTPEEALAIVPPLCDALQFAHERGIVHRDIKPENLLLDKNGRVKIADFGIAKMLGPSNGGGGSSGAGAPENITQSVVGTPGYIAPEQKSNPQRVDSRADIYSLGVVFYEMLTGELPAKRLEPPSKKVQIDVRLDAVVMRALEKAPELRWQTAADLRTQVETIAGVAPPPRAEKAQAGAQGVPAAAFDNSRLPLAYAALFFAGLSGVLGIVAICLFPNPPEVLVWSILAAALLGIILAIPARKTPLGKRAFVGGGINMAIWLVMALVINSTAFKIHVRELAHLRQWPGTVIRQTIQHEVGRQLREAGATYDDLQVAVAINRDSATPYKVSYRGLQNFKGADGTIPDANGEFIMNYIGGGQWQGALAGTQFTVHVGSQDNIDLPFVNDPQVIGEWESVDFVVNPSDFNPDKPNRTGGELYLKGLTFLDDGKMPQPWMTWTKGVVIHHGDKTASHYEIREINGKSYMFLEWKSGDFTISGMKPCYHVLRKTSSTGALCPPTNALTFGPVIERVLPVDDSGHTDLLDLDSGKIVKPVPYGTTVPFTAAGVTFWLPAMLMTSANATIKAVHNDDWESLTAQAASEAIGKLEFTPAGRGEYTPDDQLPKTLIFKTRAGGMGILQITGLNGNHRSLYIRYKPVRQIKPS